MRGWLRSLCNLVKSKVLADLSTKIGEMVFQTFFENFFPNFSPSGLIHMFL
jgi:hypothetical protein